jgi:hypothetical protein
MTRIEEVVERQVEGMRSQLLVGLVMVIALAGALLFL